MDDMIVDLSQRCDHDRYK